MILPLFLLIILGIDWACGYAIAGYVMHHGVSPYGYAFWQCFGPFLCLFIIQFFRKDLIYTKGSLIYSIACGLFGIAIPNLLIYFASKYIQSSTLTIIANVAPLFTYPLALIFKQEKFKFSRFGVLIIGVIGILLLVTPIKQDLGFDFTNYWLYIALLIPFCYALSAVVIARFRPIQGNVLNYALWMLLVAVIFITPITMIQHSFYDLTIFNLNSGLIILEVILSTLGYVLLFIIIKMVGPVYYTLVNAIAVLTGVILGLFIFNQHFTMITYIATILILIAILGLTYLQSRKK